MIKELRLVLLEAVSCGLRMLEAVFDNIGGKKV